LHAKFENGTLTYRLVALGSPPKSGQLRRLGHSTKEPLQGAAMTSRGTFHDLITAIWEQARSHLTPRQRGWGEAYLSLEYPTDAEVARVLGISRAASSKMKWRVAEILRPFFSQFLDEKQSDEILETITLRSDQRILDRGEHIVKKRGQKHELWKPVKAPHPRLGSWHYLCEKVKTIDSIEDFKGVPVVKCQGFRPSALSNWWHEKVISHIEENSLDF